MKKNTGLKGMMKLLCSEPTAQSHDEIASCPTSPAASLFADVICPPDSISFFCSVSTWDPPRITLGDHVDRHASSGRIPKGTNGVKQKFRNTHKSWHVDEQKGRSESYCWCAPLQTASKQCLILQTSINQFLLSTTNSIMLIDASNSRNTRATLHS